MGTISGSWSGDVEFQKRQTYISISNIGISDTAGAANTLYVYFGWGNFISTSNFSYNGTSKASVTTSSTRSYPYTINWNGGDARLEGTYQLEIVAPALPHVKMTMDSAIITESVSNGTPCSFYVIVSPTSYDNDSNIFYKSDTYIFILTINVTNPPYNNYDYPIHFYDGSTLLSTLVYRVRSREFEFNYYPASISASGYQNADAMYPQSIVKPGYRSLGWDTSSSATNVVYGGRDVSSLDIPEDVIPYSSGLNLYSVWEKIESVFIYVGNERKTVTRIDIVTNVNSNNNTITTHTVRSGKIYDGTTWREFSL